MTAPQPAGAPTHSVARAATGMGATTAVSRGFGFVRVLVVAAVLGTTYLGNAFQSANLVSNVLFELIAAGALSAVLVPTFVRRFAAGDAPAVERLAGGLLGLATVVLGAVSVLGVLAAPWIADLLTAGVSDAGVRAEQADLTAFLLRFFIPQVVLYAWGAIAIAVLNAQRRFSLPAGAPIANTVVMVVFLGAFRAMTGPNPTLSLTLGEQLMLAAAGTVGVLAYVAVPVTGVARSGFRFRVRVRRDPEVRRVLRLSGWATLLHIGTGLLLAAALIVGNGVAGGSLAYNVAYVFFLAPYAILAQPVLTTILPELTAEHDAPGAYARSVRWSLDTMALLVVPVSAAMVALALPFARVVSFGAATEGGPELIAAGLASLGLGLFGYSAFLMLARASYALDDSRTPAVIGVVSSLVGVAFMFACAPFTEGAARVAALGLGHSLAMALGATALGIVLSRRVGHSLAPRALLRAVAASVPLAAAAWAVAAFVDPPGRSANLVLLLGLGGVGGAIYLGAIRMTGGLPRRVVAA